VARELLRLDLADPRWTGFVDGSADALPFHDPAWARMLGECYGYRPFALALADDGALVAGAPVLEVRSLRGARRWSSLPFTDYCPPLAREAADATELAARIAAAASAAGVGAVELRAPVDATAFAAAPVAVRHTLALGPDPDALLRTFHRSQVQRNIARAERTGVTVAFAQVEAELVRTYYDLHVRTRRRQGVPVQPRRFFQLLWRDLIEPGKGYVLLARVGRRAVAAAVFLTSPGAVVYKFGASDPYWWKLRPNHALFWTAIRRGCESGRQVFDWGRTDLEHTGLREFKRNWASVEEPLAYSKLTSEPAPAPGARRGARAAGAMIRRSPVWVCRALGTALYRYAA
jgi:CelD/BcsL family acetyltransferase involved in cellulose biosynthesis